MHSIGRCAMVCTHWQEVTKNSNYLWITLVRDQYSQRMSADRLRATSKRGENIYEIMKKKLSFDYILELLVADLNRSMADEFDDKKKRGLDRSTIITDVELCIHTLESLADISSQNEYIPESLMFQSSLEPILCCLCSSNQRISRLAVKILKFLVKDEPSSLVIIDSQGFSTFLEEAASQAIKEAPLNMYDLSASEDLFTFLFDIASILGKMPVRRLARQIVVCDLCGRYPYEGVNYKCRVCNDWDYCGLCYSIARHSHNHVSLKYDHRSSFYQHTAQVDKMVKALAEYPVLDEGQTHVGFSCSSCKISPIHGCRYFCLDCQNHLCQNCESLHVRNHCFLKFRFPFSEEVTDPALFPVTTGELASDVTRQITFFPFVEYPHHSIECPDLPALAPRLGTWRGYTQTFRKELIFITFYRTLYKDENSGEHEIYARVDQSTKKVKVLFEGKTIIVRMFGVDSSVTFVLSFDEFGLSGFVTAGKTSFIRLVYHTDVPETLFSTSSTQQRGSRRPPQTESGDTPTLTPAPLPPLHIATVQLVGQMESDLVKGKETGWVVSEEELAALWRPHVDPDSSSSENESDSSDEGDDEFSSAFHHDTTTTYTFS
eukprot:TRINITY_DN10599_c0_g1_i1.p1 TRINITY_DN10599_c0_g1~~TRINITY_DN10599_c0_g1_i1.p1  ORF type:complete len:622 (+),score=91.67 TRINITY_DN10599_c0_g1_i1:59-1867(+)